MPPSSCCWLFFPRRLLFYRYDVGVIYLRVMLHVIVLKAASLTGIWSLLSASECRDTQSPSCCLCDTSVVTSGDCPCSSCGLANSHLWERAPQRSNHVAAICLRVSAYGPFALTELSYGFPQFQSLVIVWSPRTLAEYELRPVATRPRASTRICTQVSSDVALFAWRRRGNMLIQVSSVQVGGPCCSTLKEMETRSRCTDTFALGDAELYGKRLTRLAHFQKRLAFPPQTET
jgi:hypothetical protein